jgi:tetratricopeptide (TPR) repeat protein
VSDPRAKARVFVALGSVMGLELGDREMATKHWDHSLRLLRGTDNPRLRAWVEHMRSAIRQFEGDTDASVTGLEAAIALFRTAGDTWGEAMSMGTLAKTFADAERWDEGEQAARRALAMSRQVGNYGAESLALHELGNILARKGHADEGVELCRQAYKAARSSGKQVHQGWASVRLCRLLWETGRYHEADEAAARAVQELAQAGEPTHFAYALVWRGMTLETLGHYDEARASYQDAYEGFARLRLPAAGFALELRDKLPADAEHRR